MWWRCVRLRIYANVNTKTNAFNQLNEFTFMNKFHIFAVDFPAMGLKWCHQFRCTIIYHFHSTHVCASVGWNWASDGRTAWRSLNVLTNETPVALRYFHRNEFTSLLVSDVGLLLGSNFNMDKHGNDSLRQQFFCFALCQSLFVLISGID